MTEFDEPFSGVYGVFKSSIDKSVPIRDLLYLQTIESVGYDGVGSYELIILSETTY